MNRMWLVWAAISLIFFWAIVLRVYGIDQPSYWIDEAYSITIAQAIADHGYPLLDSGTILWRSPTYHYALAIPVKILGDEYLVTRSLSILLGLVSIILIAYISKLWFSNRVAVITLIIMSLSYWEIAWSRQTRMYMLLQVCFWLSLLLFERWQSKKIHWLWPLCLTVITIATHQLGWILLPSMALWWALRKKHFLGWYLGIVFGTIVSASFVSWYVTRVGLVEYWGHYVAFLFTNYWGVLALALIGVVVGIYKKQQTNILWLAGVFLLTLGTVSYSVPLLQYRYIFFVIPVLYIFAGYTISRLPTFWITAPVILGLLVIFTPGFVLLPQAMYALESDSPDTSFDYKSFTPQPDFSTAYTFINAQQPDVLITPYPSMSRLYLNNDDTAAVYVDLTGTINQPLTTTEVYTGVSYLNVPQLQDIEATGQSGLIVLDSLAEYRMDPVLRTYIEMHYSEIYTSVSGPWTRLVIYGFNQDVKRD